MIKSSKLRLPRFSRDPIRAQIIKVTERDHAILRAIYRHRFLKSTHIVDLVGGSSQQVLRRLQCLFHHGYVTRPRCQLDFFYRSGSAPFVYGISSKGARTLHALAPQPDKRESRMDWTEKNNAVRQLYLQHTLLITDIMVAMEKSFRNHPTIRFISPEDLLPAHSRPLAWKVSSSTGKSSSIHPDAVFALENLESAGKQNRCYYFVEADMGTMPIERKASSKITSFARKLELYSETWHRSLHRSELGIGRFQLLTVTTSAKRSKRIAATAGKIKRGSGIFLITDRNSLMATVQSGSILDHPWLTSQPEIEDTLRP